MLSVGHQRPLSLLLPYALALTSTLIGGRGRDGLAWEFLGACALVAALHELDARLDLLAMVAEPINFEVHLSPEHFRVEEVADLFDRFGSFQYVILTGSLCRLGTGVLGPLLRLVSSAIWLASSRVVLHGGGDCSIIQGGDEDVLATSSEEFDVFVVEPHGGDVDGLIEAELVFDIGSAAFAGLGIVGGLLAVGGGLAQQGLILDGDDAFGELFALELDDLVADEQNLLLPGLIAQVGRGLGSIKGQPLLDAIEVDG